MESLISRTVAELSLDLSGLCVYTEAATGYFAVTPVIAAISGAKRVIAISRPWRGLSAAEVSLDSLLLAGYMNLNGKIEIVFGRSSAHFAEADVITNLGFVRPINREMILQLKSTAVISYMREHWERRDEDVDLHACREHGIPCFATNENHESVRVLEYSGLLCAKLLFEAGLEIANNLILIFSNDPFGILISEHLEKIGARTRLFSSFFQSDFLELLPEADAIIIADITSPKILIGADGILKPEFLYERSPYIKIIAFAGGVNGLALERAGISCVPEDGSRPGKMGRTLAYLGPEPVIRLHSAGLKVGEAAAKGRKRGLYGDDLIKQVLSNSPAQEINPAEI